MSSDSVAAIVEFNVGPDVVLRLNAAGRLESYALRGIRQPRRTKVLRVPGTGEPLSFRTDLRGTPIRMWNDAQGRVAAAQVE